MKRTIAALILLFPAIVCAQLPPPNHPITFGYYYADKPQYGDYRSQVNCYTDSYYLLVKWGAQVTPSDPLSVWFPKMQQQIADAVAAGKNVHVNLDFPDPDFISITDGPVGPVVTLTPLFDQVLDALAPYWNSVVRIELSDEPSWTKEEIDAVSRAVNQTLDAHNLPRKPLGVVNGYNSLGQAIKSAELSWVGVEAFLCAPSQNCTGEVPGSSDIATNRAALDGLISDAKFRIGQSGKRVVLVMQAYTRNNTWDPWVDVVADMQSETYLQANQDPIVVGINMFAYGIPTDGTVRFPALQNAHKQIATALYGSISCNDTTPPAAPANLRTAIYNFGFQVTLSWSSAGGNIALQRSTNGGAWSPIATLPPGSTSYVDNTPALPAGTSANYSYRAYAFNSFGNSPYSNVANITMYGSVPDIPVLIGPKDCITTLRPIFTWNASARATNYSVAVTPADHDDFFVNATGVYATSYNGLTSDLLVGVQYRWKAKGCNNVGCGNWAPSMYFKTFCSGVASTITAPLGCISTQVPTFTWTPVAGAVDYWLLVAMSPDFSASPWLINATLPPTATSYSPGYVFSPNVTYYAKIKTHVSPGSTTGGWSATISFTPLCGDSGPP